MLEALFDVKQLEILIERERKKNNLRQRIEIIISIRKIEENMMLLRYPHTQ